MPYFAVDDGFYDHPKVKSLPRGRVRRDAVSLWTLAGSWCARYPQDGLVPADQVIELGYTQKDAAALVACGLWHDSDHKCDACLDIPRGHYLFHEWAMHNPTKEVIEKRKAAARARQQRYRESQGEA